MQVALTTLALQLTPHPQSAILSSARKEKDYMALLDKELHAPNPAKVSPYLGAYTDGFTLAYRDGLLMLIHDNRMVQVLDANDGLYTIFDGPDALIGSALTLTTGDDDARTLTIAGFDRSPNYQGPIGHDHNLNYHDILESHENATRADCCPLSNRVHSRAAHHWPGDMASGLRIHRHDSSHCDSTALVPALSAGYPTAARPPGNSTPGTNIAQRAAA